MERGHLPTPPEFLSHHCYPLPAPPSPSVTEGVGEEAPEAALAPLSSHFYRRDAHTHGSHGSGLTQGG